MNETWLLYACGILLTRLAYLPDDERLAGWKSGLQVAFQVLLVIGLFQFTLSTGVLLALLLVIAGVAYRAETPGRIQSGFRLVTLAAQLLVPLAAYWLFDPFPERQQGWMVPDALLIAVFGLLVLANEANYLIRMLFNWCNLVPKLPSSVDVDQEEYKAGRVIGMLERGLIFLIVYFTGDLSAVGFILAAKGLIRIRQLKDRQFSEYMLIGTLASVLCAVVVALILQMYGT